MKYLDKSGSMVDLLKKKVRSRSILIKIIPGILRRDHDVSVRDRC